MPLRQNQKVILVSYAPAHSVFRVYCRRGHGCGHGTVPGTLQYLDHSEQSFYSDQQRNLFD